MIQNGDKYEYHYGKRNRLESIYVTEESETEGRLFTRYWYDANGNTVKREVYPAGSETQVLDLEYDTMNRLVKSVLDGEATTYSYDNAGNRLVKKTPEGTTVYLRHGQIAVAMDIELPADVSEQKGRVNRYVLSGDLLAGRVSVETAADGVSSVAKSYYHLDHLNSTKAVTDESGVLEVLYEYRAFGEQLKRLDATGADTEDSAKYSYGGKELDDTELYYFNARYYDAAIGRFVNVDPIQDGSNVDRPGVFKKFWSRCFRTKNLIRVDSDITRSGMYEWRSHGRGGNSLEDDNPAPHEFGHLLGFRDRYTDSKGREPGWERNIMGNSREGDTEQRNIDILEGIQKVGDFLNSNSNVKGVF